MKKSVKKITIINTATLKTKKKFLRFFLALEPTKPDIIYSPNLEMLLSMIFCCKLRSSFSSSCNLTSLIAKLIM